MKKLISVLIAAVFALTVSGFALAADNAAKAPKTETTVEKTEKKVEKKKTTSKKGTKKSKKKTETKEEVTTETPAPVKK